MNQRLTDLRRAQLDQLLSGGTNMAGGGLLKSVAKAAQKVLPAVEREANLAKFLAESKTPMRLYHGTQATEGGKGAEAIRHIKPSKEGALGSGVYMTPKSNFADEYALDGMNIDNIQNYPKVGSGNVLPVHAQLKNPLILGDPNINLSPAAEALFKLGIDKDKAAEMIERLYEDKGNIGKQIQARAQAQGYDGLMLYHRDGELGEVVSYNPNTVKSAIGNQGTYDTSVPDLNKAGGGLLKAVAKSAKPAAKAVEKTAELALKIKPPSDNIRIVRESNFTHSRPVGNQTVKIGDLSGGVRLSDPQEKRRVKELADKISSPDGYISRIIVDQDNNVIEGQHRLEALRQLGVQDVPVYKIEDLEATMPVDKMKSAMSAVGPIHSDHVNQLVDHALEHISEGGMDNARQMNYGKFQKHYDAALDAAEQPNVKALEAAPQAEALRLAQQRAKSVGQSKDPRTRMLQQGYDDSWYHGTTGDISRFRPDLLGETTGAQSAKKGFFFARDPLNPPESMLKKSNDPAAGDLLRKMGIPEEDIAKLNTVSMEGHGPETASGYALIGGSREYKEAMRKAKAAERRGDWPEYEKQMQIAEDSETTRMQYGQNVIAKYGDARDEMLEDIKNVWYGPQNSERFKNMSQADYEAYDKKFKELMPYGWYNSYSNSQLEGLKKELFDSVGEKNAEKVLNKINKFQSARNERALIEKTQEGGNVMPVALRYENPMVYDFEGKPYRDQSYSDLVDQALTAGNDALILKNTYDPGGGPSRLIDVGVVFEPDQIRSRFAAFDPLRKTAATAAAAGLAAPDLLAKEQDKAQGGLVHLAGGGDPKKADSDYPLMGDPSQFSESSESKFYPKTERMNRGVKAIKSGLDSFNRFIDQGPSVRDVLGSVVGAVPFVGPDLRKGMEDSTLTIPYEFQRSATNPRVATGVNTAKVPTTDILDALKMSDITGGTGASNLLGSVGKGYAPDPMDVLDTLGLGAVGYGAAKAGAKGAKAAGKGALKALEQAGTGPKAGSMAAQRGAVKLGGGNWVDSEVKRSLGKLKQDDSYPQIYIDSAKTDLAESLKKADVSPDDATQAEILKRDIAQMEQTNAFNKWVDTKAGSYVRNQMSTPDDPVVKMLDVRAAKIEADYQAGQKRLAKLDERIAQAPANTTEEQNTLANLKRTRSQRAAEIESDRELAMTSMLPGGKDHAGYDYLKNNAADLINTREEAGFPIAGYGQSDAAKAWEAAQDSGIGIRPAENYQGQAEKLAAARDAGKAYDNYMKIELRDKFKEFINKSGLPESDKQALIQNTPSYHMKEMMGGEEKYDEVMNNLQQARSKANASNFAMAEDNPYLAKLPPETLVYNAFGLGDLGIDHIIDVLKDDVATGKLKLEDLNKITMDQALKRAAEYDFEMAKKARDAVAQSRATMPVYKEYPEGYKWVQLTKPGEFNAESNAMGHSVRGYEPEKGHPDWTPESGDSGNSYYGHGGWEAIKSGKAKVYSLVDPSGKPHSTIEVKFNKPETWNDAAKETNSEKMMEYWNEFNALKNADPSLEDPVAANKKLIEFFKSKGIQGNQEITQIKGKGNARPSEKYDQYTQDFVKSGKWADVSRNDLRNTGLIEHSGKYFTEPEFVEAAKKYGRMGVQNTPWEVARQRHIDAGVPEEEALLNWVEAFKDGRGKIDIPDEPNMAGGGLLSKIGKAAKAARAAEELVPAAGRMKFADQPRGGLNVIKETGGNWLGGSVESQLKDLKSKGSTEADREWLINHAKQNPVVAQIGLDSIPKNEAINKWVESNLTNYVKKQMATPDDPVRKLAEEGVIHMPINAVDTNRNHAQGIRKMHGSKQMGQSEAAKSWEDVSDISIYPGNVGEIKRVKEFGGPGADKYEPWMEKADPNTVISRTTRNFSTQDLGFDHIVDVLKQDVAEGRIRPEQLSKVSMEQAVRRTYEYDQEMAKKMRETQAKVTEGMPVYKEYPEGYKWIELAKPKDLPKGYTVSQNKDTESFQVFYDNGTPTTRMEFDTPEEAISFFNSDSRLEDALKYEGDTMGHCVGGYCPDVAAGRSRIFSLRDAKGEPHVTVEVKPHANYEEAARILETDDPTSGDIARLVAEGKLPGTQRITQIKGKGNRAPKEEYLPFVQDFVKGGNWSGVNELQNAGLKVYKGDGGVKYVTPEEYNIELQKELGLLPPEEGMAGGGSVGLRNALNNLLRTDKPEVHMQVGGKVVAKAAKAAEKAAEAAKVAGKAAEYLPGVHYADPIKPPTMKMSEALGNAGAEGKTLNFTETDRSRVFGPNRGGTGFSGLQHYSLPHKEANTVWGFGNKTTAEKKIRQNDPENTIWTTYAGSPNQHKSNTIVVKDALSQLQSANSQGLVNSKQIEFINERIRSSVGQNGNPLFPSNFDITDPKAFDYATTFDRRAAISDALMGIGVKKPMISKEFKAANPGVKWSDAANIDAILRRETDPAMLDANTFDVGPHLFTMDNGVIERPDLNEAFPYQVTGTDLGLRYELAPMRAAAPDWIKARNIKPNEPINAWAMSRAAPSQFVSEAYLTSLQKQGKKKGGLAQTKKVKRHGNTVPH